MGNRIFYFKEQILSKLIKQEVQQESIPTIAVLMTSHNRKEKSLKCLSNLFIQEGISKDFQVEVFLVDDGSTDGTSEAIKDQFPQVNIIYGNGNLFWNQGMRLAWRTANTSKCYDFFLWLNDDTFMDKDALRVLLDTDVIVRQQNELRLITSACRESELSNVFSYGGRTDNNKVIPNGEIQECKFVNGNLVLIPKELYSKLGNLSSDYTHSIGDNDYGLRCLEIGGKCYTTVKYIATCLPNEGIPGWCNANISFQKRWKLFHSPKGLNIKEYVSYRKRFFGKKWITYAIKAYLKTIFPRLFRY